MRTLPLGLGAPSSPGGRRLRWPGARATIGTVLGWLVFAILLLVTVLPVSATTKTSAARVTFGIAPASMKGPNGRSYLSYGVTPGATLRDHVAVLNYSSIPLSLQVYVTDASETSSGGFGLLARGQTPTGVDSWVSLPARFSNLRVGAQSADGPGRVIVPLTVQIPDNAAPGDHVGGIVVSLRTVGTNATGQKVVLLQRVGTRVFIRVAGKLAPRVAIEDLRPSYHGTLNPLGAGQVKVSYVLSNTGNIDLALSHQTVSVSGLLGSRQAVLGGASLLLPGASLDESAVLPGIWPEFLLHTSVSARPYAPAGTSAPGLVSATASASLWAVPWSPIALVVLVVVVLRLGFRIRARRAARQPASRPQVVSA